jgi:hypothetical protein
LKIEKEKNFTIYQEVIMNKKVVLTMLVLASVVSIFAEIKFQPPSYLINYENDEIQSFFQDPSNPDLIWFPGGSSFNYSTGSCNGLISTTMNPSCINWDKFGHMWLGGINDGITILGASEKATDVVAKYSSANGMVFKDINIFISYPDSNWMIVGSDSGVSVAKLNADGSGVASWSNALSVSIHDIVVDKGQIWAINSNAVYRDSCGTWVKYQSQFSNPASYFHPEHGAVDLNGNFWLSFTRSKFGHGDTSGEDGLAKYDGKGWTEYFVQTVKFSIDSVDFGKIIIDKNNFLWFVGEMAVDISPTTSVGRINLSDMSIERIFVSRGRNPVNGNLYEPLGWLPSTVSTTSKGDPFFGGVGCLVKIDNSSSVTWQKSFVKAAAAIGQKNVSGSIIDACGRIVARVNNVSSLNSFSKSLPRGNYFFRPANSVKVEKFSTIR